MSLIIIINTHRNILCTSINLIAYENEGQITVDKHQWSLGQIHGRKQFTIICIRSKLVFRKHRQRPKP